LERGLKPLPNELLVIIIKINLTMNYQILLNCNKVHRAALVTAAKFSQTVLIDLVLILNLVSTPKSGNTVHKPPNSNRYCTT
jgi:hypothetical protein